ncbi:MAG: hypothetical protein ACRD1Y_10920 [Terriglobales bacterium]
MQRATRRWFHRRPDALFWNQSLIARPRDIFGRFRQFPASGIWLRANGHRIARHVGPSRSTLSRVLRRLRLSRLRELDPHPPVQRYEHAAAGDLLLRDIKKLDRIVRASHRVTGEPRKRGWHRLGASPRPR